MLYNGAHPVHKKFGDSVGAESFYIGDRMTKKQNVFTKGAKLVKNVLSLPEIFNFMLTESCYYYPAFKRKFGGMKKTKIINLSCSPLFYHLLNGRIIGAEKKLLLDLTKEIDGHLVLGKYGEEILRKIDKEKPFKIVYPFVTDGNYEKLMKVKPNLNSKNIVIIATNDYRYKGLDTAIEAVKAVWREDKEIKLNVIGNIDVKVINTLSKGHPAINYLGFVSNLAETLGEHALYIHPARGDTFPVSVLEAMAAGLPSIVSYETGTKEAVQNVNRGFVLKNDPEKLSKTILDYFSVDENKKKTLSEKFRKETEKYREEKMLELFRKQTFSILKEIS